MKSYNKLTEDEISNIKINIQRMVQRGSNIKEIQKTLDISKNTILRIEPEADVNEYSERYDDLFHFDYLFER